MNLTKIIFENVSGTQLLQVLCALCASGCMKTSAD